jgi:hypothetical protein
MIEAAIHAIPWWGAVLIGLIVIVGLVVALIFIGALLLMAAAGATDSTPPQSERGKR